MPNKISNPFIVLVISALLYSNLSYSKNLMALHNANAFFAAITKDQGPVPKVKDVSHFDFLNKVFDENPIPNNQTLESWVTMHGLTNSTWLGRCFYQEQPNAARKSYLVTKTETETIKDLDSNSGPMFPPKADQILSNFLVIAALFDNNTEDENVINVIKNSKELEENVKNIVYSTQILDGSIMQSYREQYKIFHEYIRQAGPYIILKHTKDNTTENVNCYYYNKVN